MFFSYDGLTDPLGQSQVLPYIMGIASDSTRITIISAEKPRRYNEDSRKIRELIQGHNIHWVPISWTKFPPALSTVYDLNKFYKAAKKIHKETRIDFTHCRGYMCAQVGLRLKDDIGIPFLFDNRGFFPDERVEGGLWNLKNPVYKKIYTYFKDKEQRFYKEAEAIVSLTNKGKEIVNDKFKPDAKITVIPCSADFDHFDPAKVPEEKLMRLKADLGLEHHFTLSYLGSVGTWYLLDEMMVFFAELKRHRPKSKFLFITKDQPDGILSIADQQGLSPDDIIIQSASREDVPTMLALSDANIFFIKPSFSKQASSPTKMGEAMAMDLPIICNKSVGDVEDILKQVKGGVIVDVKDPGSFKDAANNILNFKNAPGEIRNRSRKVYDLDQAIQRYKKVYSEFSDGKTPLAE